MPQIFQVLRCYKCSVFQVHQTKKSNKWQCNLCGEKQSMKRHYGLGTSKDCRLHVQKLNGIRGEIDESANNPQNDTDDEVIYSEPTNNNETQLKKSKWSDYIDDAVNNEQKSDEEMFLDNTLVVLEVPKKKMKSKNYSFKFPKKNTGSENIIQRPIESNVCVEAIQMSKEKSIEPKQENFNYCKTLNKYNNMTASLEMAINNENCKERTNVPMKPNIESQQSWTPTQFVLQKINKNSRWAQFVESEENNEECVSKSLLNTKTYDLQSLFSLCEDKDLDDILDI